VILRYPHRVLSLLLSFTCSGIFPLPIPCMGRERPSGCCVILQSRFIGATSNLFLLCFMPGDGTRQRHLYSSLHTPPSPGSHLVSAFPHHHYPVAMCPVSSSCSRFYRMCILLFLPLTLFAVCIFFIRLLFLVYILPLDRGLLIILCYLTCIPS